MTTSTASAAPRSGFVTAVAVVFMVLAGFGTVIALLQNIMIALVFPAEEMRAAMLEAEKARPMPSIARFIFGNFRLFFALFLLVCAATFISSIGLVMRKNWARLAFIALMVLGVVWNLAGAAVPFLMFSSFTPP